ncbi:MAG: hypothetical protein ACT4PT_04300 [Methanobacteriota archaeon]
MAYRTVNLAPATYERLRAYKAGGKTFDDVLNDLMDNLPLERVHEDVLREHRRRIRRMKRGEYVTLDRVKRTLSDD